MDLRKSGYFVIVGLVFLCLSCNKISVPANTESSAIKIFGGGVSLSVTDMEPTSDGGFIFSGHSGTGPSTGDLAFMLKTDANGKQQWLRTFGGPQDNGFEKARQTSDGGYIAVGYTCSYGNGPKDGDYYPDGYVVKTDANGNMTWQKTYGGIYLDSLYDVKEMPDHGFVTVGRVKVMNTYYQSYIYQLYMIRTDLSGNIKWENGYFNTVYYATGQSIDISPNGDIIASGIAVKSALVVDQNTNFPCLVCVNANTGIQKGKSLIFSSFANCEQAKVVSTSDGYVMAADNIHDSTTYSPNLIKTDFSLNVKWQKQYSPGFSIANLGAISNGGFNLSGTFNSVENKCALLGIDVSGSLYSTIEFGNSGLNDVKFYASRPATINVLPSSNGYAVGAALSKTSLNSNDIFALFFSDQNGKIADHVK